MELDMAHSIEVLTVSTSSSPGHSMKNVVPLQVELTKYPVISSDERNKLRRPVRPIDRQRMRPWLMELLDLGNVFGLRWTNRHQGVFQISWRHASRLGWNLETDGDVFERWARHTGIYKEGDPPEPKRWKANFRCALHSLHDVVELTNAVERRGRNACRTYRFLQSSDEQSMKKRKTKAIRTKEIQEHSQQKCLKEMVPVTLESGSSEDIVSDTESEASHQDKVIVQAIDMRPGIPEEDFCLHHDHDYAGPDKTQKTIVLRQGVGSIMLHKEIQNAPDVQGEVESLLMSNLDQLASAAMNSACIDSVQQQELNCDYTIEKTYRNDDSLLEMPQASHPMDSDLNVSKVSLRHLLLERNVPGVHAVNLEKSTRKRKSLALADDSFMVKFAEDEEAANQLSGIKKTPVCFCSQEEMKSQSSKDQSLSQSQSTPTRQRSGSPKILCRRSKRNRARTDMCVSETSEPLMSSCLLLLEAATRLDIAEKTGMPSLSSKTRTEKHNLKVFPESSCKTKTNTHTEMVLRSSELKCGSPAKSNNPFGILRNALEDANIVTEYGDNLPKSKAMTNLLKESYKAENINAVSSSESRIIPAETPFVTGLFSGVKIQSRSPFSISYSKHEDDEGSMRPKGKLFVYEEVVMNNESATSSKSGENVNQIVSGALLSCANIPGVKSSKRITASQFDALPGTFSSEVHSPQLYVSAGSSSLEPTIQIGSSNQKCIVLTSETPGIKEKFPVLPLPASAETACIIVKEQQLLPLHKIEQMHVMDKSKIISVLGSQNVCINSTRNTENHTTKSLQTSVKSPAQRTVTFTTASCLPAISFASAITPSRVLPIYSQAEMAASAKSEILLHSKGKNVIPLQSTSIVPSNYVLASSPPISTDTSLLTIQEKDAFIYNPEKKVADEIELCVLPLTSTSYSFTKIQSDIKKTTSGNIHIITKSQAVPQTVISDVSNKSQLQLSLSSSLPNIIQSQMRTVSVLPRPCQLTSTSNTASLKGVKPSVPVIINGRYYSMGNVALSTIIKPETLDEVPSTEDKNATCDLFVKVAQGNNAVAMPSVISSNFAATEVETTTHSDIVSNPVAVTLIDCSDVSLQDHSPILLTFQQTLPPQNCSKDEDKFTKKVDSVWHADESVGVKSLAELCKRYLAHFFSTLDYHTSESEENESITESPEMELIDDTCLTSQCRDIMQSVTSQQKHVCLKPDAVSQEYKSVCRQSRYAPVQTTELSKNSFTSVCSSDFNVCSESDVTSDTVPTKRCLVYNITDTRSKNANSDVDISAATVEDQSQTDCVTIIDPSVPISIGEISLFATNKGDLSSQSLISD